MSKQSDLLKQLEEEHNIQIAQKEIQEEDDEFDDTINDQADLNSELDNFDKKIQIQKEAKRIYNGDQYEQDQENSEDSDNQQNQQKEDAQEYFNIIRQQQQQKNLKAHDIEKPQKKVLFGSNPEKPPQYKPPPSIEKIQQNIMTQQKVKVQNSEDQQILELLSNGSEGMKEKKIRELVTRCRNFQVQYEREKALRIKMENQLNQMIKDNEEVIRYREEKMGIQSQQKSNQLQKSRQARSNTGNASDVPSEAGFSVNSDVDWQKKYQMADKKLQEFRVSNQQLKNELNKANRVISREIGENFNIDKVLMEENSWKGRAQTIEKLKAKVRDLQNKFGMATNASGFTEFSSAGGMGLGGGTSKFDKSANERRKEIEQLKDQNSKLQEEQDLIQSKIKAINSRKNNLENEIKDIKQEYEKNKKVLLAKSNADDQYIQALKAEYEKLKKSKNEPRIIYKNSCEHDHSAPTILQQDQIKMKQDIDYYKEELKTKEQMIQELIQQKLEQDELMMRQQNFNGNQQSFIQQQQPSKPKEIPQNSNNDELMQKNQKLEQEIKVLKRERTELFNTKLSDKDSRMIIKDLSMQNAQLRGKLDDLKLQIKK